MQDQKDSGKRKIKEAEYIIIGKNAKPIPYKEIKCEKDKIPNLLKNRPFKLRLYTYY